MPHSRTEERHPHLSPGGRRGAKCAGLFKIMWAKKVISAEPDLLLLYRALATPWLHLQQIPSGTTSTLYTGSFLSKWQQSLSLEQHCQHEPSTETPSRLGTQGWSTSRNQRYWNTSRTVQPVCFRKWLFHSGLPHEPLLEQNIDRKGLKKESISDWKRLSKGWGWEIGEEKS